MIFLTIVTPIVYYVMGRKQGALKSVVTTEIHVAIDKDEKENVEEIEVDPKKVYTQPIDIVPCQTFTEPTDIWELYYKATGDNEKPDLSTGIHTYKTVDEVFKEKTEFKMAIGECFTVNNREEEFSRQSYSFTDSYTCSGSCHEDSYRRHQWENYQMDYMGPDSSNNVLAKLETTLLTEAHHPHTYLPLNRCCNKA